MRPITEFSLKERRRIRGVFFDIDDTLTTAGKLTAEAYSALERLSRAGFLCVPITGRPAGWCDHIARMWPIDAVVGENGAFYFRYLAEERTMERRFFVDAERRADHRRRLERLRARILADVPGAAVSADQGYRAADLAIDFCEDVPRLSPNEVERIVEAFHSEGAQARISSIHVNGWYGEYDKLAMTRNLLAEAFGVDLDTDGDRYVFIGDSPNDAPLFAYFANAVGVANVRNFVDQLTAAPAYVTARDAGAGFAELAEALLEVHHRAHPHVPRSGHRHFLREDLRLRAAGRRSYPDRRQHEFHRQDAGRGHREHEHRPGGGGARHRRQFSRLADLRHRPQILPRHLGVCIYRLDANVRHSTVVGIVGAGGIGIELYASINQFAWREVAVMLIAVFGVVIVSEFVSAMVRARIN